MRLWVNQDFTSVELLEGHTDCVSGVLALSDGRLLSWSRDTTLRLWDRKIGANLVTFVGHTDLVEGALELADGRLLSWSGDKTLRLWDGKLGVCLAVLEGHTNVVRFAVQLSDGRLLSRSWFDNVLRVWDGRSGACLEVFREDQLGSLHPEWLPFLQEEESKPLYADSVFLDFIMPCYSAHAVQRCQAQLRHKKIPATVSAWNAESDAQARCLLMDGTAVVTQANGQVCILKLHYGNHRVSLAEAEEILAP
jgi:WD40 repeat protein